LEITLLKAQVCSNFGPVDNLEYIDVPKPEPGMNEILIKVHSIGINFADSLVIQGKYQASPPLPFIPGTETAGVVVSIGSNCKQFKVGDRVHGYNRNFGAFAEYALLPENGTGAIPKTLSFDEGATLLAASGTAHHALRQKAHLLPNENLVVLGAAGGTGSAAIQIGKAIGARVIAACSSEEKIEFARSLGAHEFINYSDEDLKSSIKKLTDGKGADVIYDTVGGDAFDASTRAIAWNGRLLVVGFASGRIPLFPTNLALVKGFSVVGVFWGTFIEAEPVEHSINMRELYEWVEKKVVSPKIDKHFRLKDCRTALDYISGRRVLGKVVMNP